MAPDGRFVVAYQSRYNDWDTDGFVRKYKASGQLDDSNLYAPSHVAYTGYWEGSPSVAMDQYSNFTVAYLYGASSASGRVDGRLFRW